MNYDHYIAVDWAQSNMAIARMTAKAERIQTVESCADIGELKVYLGNLKGRKILTIEESTPAQWLYTELKNEVDEILVCDPRRNHLLSEGAKTDKIDAEKLVRLLRANMLKPVFHTSDHFIYLRKLVSGYEDLVKAGVRLKNQRSALFRSNGLSGKEALFENSTELFVLEGLDSGIAAYALEKARYEAEFERHRKQQLMIRNLSSLPGIATIGAVKIAARVVEPRRFANKNAFISYCGLIKLEKISGGRSYGKKSPRYSHALKSVFKTAALVTIGDSAKGPLKDYYEHLKHQKRYPDSRARHAVARRIAVLAFGVLKSGKKFDAGRLRQGEMI